MESALDSESSDSEIEEPESPYRHDRRWRANEEEFEFAIDYEENQRDVVREKIEESKKNVAPELDDDHVVQVPKNVEEQLRNVGTEKLKGQVREHYFLEWYSVKEVPEKIAEHVIIITLQNDTEDAQTQNKSTRSDPVNPVEHCGVFNDPIDICDMTVDDFEGEGHSVGNQAWMDDILQDQSSDADTMHMIEAINRNVFYKMDVDAEKWILMTDQQKGLENAIATELPKAEHRLCCKHLYDNWKKKFPCKAFKDLMREAATAANMPYHNLAMIEIKKLSIQAYDALAKIEKKKWTRAAFREGSNCDMVVNNWAKAFNVVIIKAGDQHVISMLNTIHNMMVKRVAKEARRARKWQGDVSPRISELIKYRSSKVSNYITTFNGQNQYGVSTAHHAWVVKPENKKCSCGLWQLSGVPCMHAVCVYMAQSKDPLKYVDGVYKKATQNAIYSHFLAPLRGPAFWPSQPNLPDINPPDICVLPGRPKRCRNVDENEKKGERSCKKGKTKKIDARANN